MKNTINIHPDLKKMPSLRAVNRPWLVAVMNAGLQIAAAFKWFKYRRIVTRHTITGLDDGRFPLWIIKPQGLPQFAPALIYYHGSGFMVKHVPQHIENAVNYARNAQCCVLFVDYRLAPKYQFPIPFDDCYAVLEWMLHNASSLGIDTQRIAIGGDSAGGALAASVVQKALHESNIPLCGQLLVYPITDCRCNTYSSTAFANVPPFKEFDMPSVWETYLGKFPGNNPPPYASPMHGDISGLPRTYIETEEYDPWRDEGVAYANALKAEGVDLVLNEVKGSLHGFDAFAPESSLVKNALEERVRFLRRIFQ